MPVRCCWVRRIERSAEILITERDPKHPLTDQSHDLVLNEVRTPHIVKTAGESLHHVITTTYVMIRSWPFWRASWKRDAKIVHQWPESRPSIGWN